MSILADGRRGEELARDWLHKGNFEFFQPDWLVTNGPFIVEAKYQERYEAPPFDGHGLPERQVRSRLVFQQRQGIPTLLLVFDKGTGETFYEWLHILDAGDKYVTGLKRRVVYPLSNFRTGGNDLMSHGP